MIVKRGTKYLDYSHQTKISVSDKNNKKKLVKIFWGKLHRSAKMHLPTDNIEINRANPNKWLFMLLSYKSVTTKKKY